MVTSFFPLERLRFISLAVALAAGCAGQVSSPEELDESSASVDDGPYASETPSPSDTPSHSWHIGHALSQGVVDGRLPLRLRAQTLERAAVAGSTFCLIAGAAVCQESDADGVIEFPPATSRLLIASTSGDYASSLFTITLGDTLDLTETPLPVLSGDELDAVYRDAGVAMDPALGAVMVELREASEGEARVILRGQDGRDSVLEAYRSGAVAYFLGVPPGNVVLAFERDGVACGNLGTNGWRTPESNEVTTLVSPGSLSYAGSIECLP